LAVNYTIEAKPTTYHGVNFRSRLEARWAAFYDSYDYRWAYEPIDFGSWSPDFLLTHKTYTDFVEVKPILDFDKETGDKMMKHSSGNGGLLLCGLGPCQCWLNTKGWWEPFVFEDSESHWNAAGNIVQWHR
jgi:hypothetical protein